MFPRDWPGQLQKEGFLLCRDTKPVYLSKIPETQEKCSTDRRTICCFFYGSETEPADIRARVDMCSFEIRASYAIARQRCKEVFL